MIGRRLSAVAVVAALLLTVSLAWASEAPDVIKLKKNLEISKDMVVKDVIVVGGDLTVLGKVEGNVVVVGGLIMVKPGAYIGGSVVVVGEIAKDPASQVIGKITQVYMPHFIPSAIDFFKGGWVAFWAALSLLALVGFLGLSILVIALIPVHMGTMVGGLERSFFMMFAWGLLSIVLIIPVAVLLAISIVGIVLIPLEMLLVALALIIGYVASASFIGNKIFSAVKKPVVPFMNAVLGIIILFLVGCVPLVGDVVKSIFLIAGFGAVVTSRFGTVAGK